MRFLGLLLSAIFIGGCGLKDPQAVMESPKSEVIKTTVQGKPYNIYQKAITSEHLLHSAVHHTFNQDKHKGFVWMGNHMGGILATVQFLPAGKKAQSTKIIEYYYVSGQWDKRMAKFKKGVRE